MLENEFATHTFPNCSSKWGFQLKVPKHLFAVESCGPSPLLIRPFMEKKSKDKVQFNWACHNSKALQQQNSCLYKWLLHAVDWYLSYHYLLTGIDL